MTVEELLMPRYKVIADFIQWSVFKYKIGDILYKKGIHFVGSGSARGVNENEIDLYPAIFRNLNWWEERKVEDMPEYVKWTKNWDAIPVRSVGDVMLAEKWILNTHFVSNGEGWKLTGGWFEPATEQEYNDYINSKSNAKP